MEETRVALIYVLFLLPLARPQSSSLVCIKSTNDKSGQVCAYQLNSGETDKAINDLKGELNRLRQQVEILQTSNSSDRGSKGDKGDMGVNCSIPQEQIDRIDNITQECEAKLENITSKLEQMQEKLATLERVVIKTARFGNCKDIAQYGFKQSGLYDVIINGTTVTVYCDLQTAGGKWMVLQRRQDGSEEFNRNWAEYEQGFGNKSGEFWIGLKNMHSLTTSLSYELRVDLEDWEGNTAYAVYSTFSVGNSSSNYMLNVGGYSGNAGDSMAGNHNLNNQSFSTKDRDNDAASDAHCAEDRHGGWWYRSCGYSNLNGQYFTNGISSWHGVVWYYWKSVQYSMKRAEMKIRPM